MNYHTLPLFSLQPETREIPLTQGKVAIVDAFDYEWLSQWKWCASRWRHLYYAVRIVSENGRRFPLRMHRAIMMANPDMEVDHIDGDCLNNTRANLRICTHQENQRNRPAQKNNTSGFKGVTRNKRWQIWQASIMVDQKSIFLGNFRTAEEAAKAYDLAARDLFGEFAWTNFK